MIVVFRADGSTLIGQGHVMRCLTLAHALREQGAEISFVCREHQGHLCDLITQRGFAVHRLPLAHERLDHLPGYGWWLGASWEVDAQQTRQVIQSLGGIADVLVVDHYAVDHRWETALRPSATRILAIDDLADRVHDCDILLDQNFFSNMATRYEGKVSAGCVNLLGPRYALMQPVYGKLHSQVKRRDGPVRNILVFFGGADTENLTGTSVSAFQQLGRRDIHLDVVMTATDVRYQAVDRAIKGWGNICLHGPLPSLGPLMANADLAIGAGGATVWERLCLGLPSLVISLAKNQEEISIDLAAEGLIRYLGEKKNVGKNDIYLALAMLVDSSSLSDWSAKCFDLCDGKGALRVVDYLQSVCPKLSVDGKYIKERV